jgi:hypothetical protein
VIESEANPIPSEDVLGLARISSKDPTDQEERPAIRA